MAIDGSLLGLQRRSLPLGEIRNGTSKAIPGKNGRKPVRLETLRFTTQVRETAEAVAGHYGGHVAPWEMRRGYWEVITERDQVNVWVPPRGLAVDSLMELWDGRKCLRRCDGHLEQRSGQPCLCPLPDDPQDPEDVARAYAERQRLARLRPAQACSVRTRYNVAIPELPGLTGVWKAATGSANAAAESADSGEALERARASGVFLPALLLISWRPGQDGNPYPVLALRLRQSAVQVAAGELPTGLSGLLSQLQAGDGERRAITSGQPVAVPAQEPVHEPAGLDGEAADPGQLAQQIADLVPLTAEREDVRKLATRAKDAGVFQLPVCTDRDPEVWEDLHTVLDARWRELPRHGRQPEDAA